MTVEAVRGALDDALATEILAFWQEQGALRGDAARARLPEVVCVLRGDDGRIHGVSSAFVDWVPLVGNRAFHVLRRLVAPGAPAGRTAGAAAC